MRADAIFRDDEMGGRVRRNGAIRAYCKPWRFARRLDVRDDRIGRPPAVRELPFGPSGLTVHPAAVAHLDRLRAKRLAARPLPAAEGGAS